MAVGEGSTGAGLQVAFKFGGLFSSREGGVAAERPGAEFRSVWNAAFVVFCQADLEIAGQADVALVWLRLALKKVDETPSYAQKGFGGQPSSRLWLASRSLGEGWWRRRELNPRPRKFPAKRLRAFPIRWFSSAPCGTGKRGAA